MQPRLDKSYRPELDGIRALAIIAVIAYHAGVPYFSRGFVGVDFFFVISGYLITGILAHEALNTGRLDLSGFYARRIRRLMPAALFMLTICVALYAWFIPPVVGSYHALARSIVTNAFFASNFFFYRQGNGYFDESMTQFPLLHTWSLSAEEQYYLLWPLLIWAIVKWQVPPAGQQGNLSLIRKLRGLLWFLFVASFSFCVYYTGIDDKFAFYLLPARIWEFAAGGLLALYLLNTKLEGEISRKQAWLGTGLATLGVVLCVLSIQFVDSNTLHYQGLWAVWPVSGMTALIAGLTINRAGFWSRFFSLRPLVWLGLLSYSWYLWHWPLLTIQKIYALGGDSLIERVGMCLLALLAAFVSYRFVERPIRERKPWLFATTKGTLIAGGLMVLMMLVLAALAIANTSFQQLNPQHRMYEAAKDDNLNRQKICGFQSKQYTSLKICGQIEEPPNEKRPVIVLWGDSHAEHFFDTLATKYPDHDIHALASEACPPITDKSSFLLQEILREREYCAVFNQDVIKHIHSLGKRLSTVYISARWPMYFGQYPIVLGHEPKPADYPHQKMYSAMQTGLADTLNQLSDINAKIFIVGPLPSLLQSAPKCLVRNSAVACNIERSVSDDFTNSSYSALQTIVKAHKSVDLIDLRPYFCNETTCFASKNGRPLYADDNHITATTAKELAGYLKH